MNAHEKITTINAAHEVLMKADDALCVDQVACAIIGKKPTKAEIKSTGKLLRELADLGLIEMKPRAGGIGFYQLIAEPRVLAPAVCDLVQTEGSAQTHVPEFECELKPKAQAERDEVVVAQHPDTAAIYAFAEKMDSKMAASRAKGRDGWSSTTEVSNERLADDLISHLHKTNAGNFIDLAIYAMMLDHRGASPEVLQKSLTQQQVSLDLLMLGHCSDYKPWEVLNPVSVVSVMDQLIEAQHTRLLQLERLVDGLPEGAIDGGWTAAGHSRYAKSLEDNLATANADLEAVRRGYTKAINEADRLRAELIAERQAREALQSAVGAKDAVGYLVRSPKRKPRLLTKPERAQEAALAAVRAGAGRAEVLAVVPFGIARRGAEWQGATSQAKGE